MYVQDSLEAICNMYVQDSLEAKIKNLVSESGSFSAAMCTQSSVPSINDTIYHILYKL